MSGNKAFHNPEQGSELDSQGNKKSKQQQSCDACRIRKVKCEAPPDDAMGNGFAQDKPKSTCKHCLGVGLQCTYEYVPKKRGPPNLYVKRLEEAKAKGIELTEIDPKVGRTASRPRRNKRSRTISTGKEVQGKSADYGTEQQDLPGSGDNEHRYMEDIKAQTSASLQYDHFGAPLNRTTSVLDMKGGNRDQTESFERTPVGSGDEDDGFPKQSEALSYLPTARHEPPYFIRMEDTSMSASGRDGAARSNSVLATGSLAEAPTFVMPSTDISPMIYERSGLKYVVTPSDSGSMMGGAYGQIPANQIDGISYSQKADAGPSTTGSEPISLPVHELQSGTLGEIGRFYSAYNAPYTSPPTDFLTSASPNISSLLNPDPLNRAALLPDYSPPRSPIDAILPRPLLHLIIGLFKDFVYPLTPCIHMPTLMQDLAKRRELEPGQEEWTALVLSTVMTTIVQVPRAFIPLSREEVSSLGERCHVETRKWSMSGYSDDSLTVNAVIVNYFRAIFNYVRDRSVSSCHASLLEAQALATVLKLHEEDSYTFLNPIEREIRRRIWFLLFCADKSESVLLGRPVKMREEDCFSLRLPEELDDEYITETRYLHQPRGVTSLITGLNAAIRIYCLIGRTLGLWRQDKRTRPTGARLEARIDEVDRLLEEVMGIMRGCPPELKLRGGMDSRVQSPSREFARDAEQVLQELFFDPKASREYARDAYSVQAGNIYVNQVSPSPSQYGAPVTYGGFLQQLARFVLLQYQNELIGLKNAYESRITRPTGPPRNGWINAGGISIGGVVAEHVNTDRLPSEAVLSNVATHLAAKEETLFYDLLTVLHSIPIQCIAVNGPSLVNSVRYIASALLDTVAVSSESDSKPNQLNTEPSNSVLRAQSFLLEFLSVLSDIEKHYSWSDVGDDAPV